MVKSWMRENRVAAGYLLGILMACCISLLWALSAIEGDEQDRVLSLRWENDKLHRALARAQAAASQEGSGGGGPS